MAGALTLSGLPAARAQVTLGSESRAEQLFREGRRLLDEQRPLEACQRFRESLAIKPGVGNLLNVAACLVREGEPVEALEHFERARALANETADAELRRAAIAVAQQQIDALSPKVALLTLSFTDTPGLSFELNGKPIAEPRLRLKPGAHELIAQAPGHARRSLRFEVSPGQQLELIVPPLEPLAESEGTVDGGEPKGRARLVPWLLVGTGAAFLAAGTATGVVTLGKASELEDNCKRQLCPSDSEQPGSNWQGKIDAADDWALGTTLLLGAGIASAGVGLALLFWGNSKEHFEPPVDAGCTGVGCGVRWHGSF